ncbi:MAG: hypothetical protein ABIS50_16400 [Luteolibacter sp.]|uniref:hypothetical protein n=1 Tax=Luteolibacter sp. TaxID=1962973 RepID=UPI0032655D9F
MSDTDSYNQWRNPPPFNIPQSSGDYFEIMRDLADFANKSDTDNFELTPERAAEILEWKGENE